MQVESCRNAQFLVSLCSPEGTEGPPLTQGGEGGGKLESEPRIRPTYRGADITVILPPRLSLQAHGQKETLTYVMPLGIAQ